MMKYVIRRTSSDELMHFGIKGQKWGVRRYENEDGTLTEEGKKRYAKAQIDASKYKTAKERAKTIAKSGLRGAAAGALFFTGAAGQYGAHKLYEEGKSTDNFFKSLKRGFDPGHVETSRNMESTVILSAIAGLGAMGVTGLYQGAQAIKVKRGQNFIKKYEDAFKKTYI